MRRLLFQMHRAHMTHLLILVIGAVGRRHRRLAAQIIAIIVVGSVRGGRQQLVPILIMLRYG